VAFRLACVPLRTPPDVPWIRRLAGNWKPGTTGAPNTLYLSENHARRHGGHAWVYNGVDPADFVFRPEKDDYDLFLGRLHGVKGYRWAIEGAKRTRRRLLVAGGWRPSLSRWVRYVGKVGGDRKAALLAGARVLWMPALWDEPFGITLIEALVSGTPVLGTHRGSLPEVISPEVGALGDTVEELIALRPAGARNFQLGQVRWLMTTEAGELVCGVKYLPGVPQAVAARGTGVHLAEEQFVQAIALGAVPALQSPPTLVLPSGWFKPRRVIEASMRTTTRLRLHEAMERGADFERVTFEPFTG